MDGRPGKAELLLALISTVLGSYVMWEAATPPQEKYWMKLRLIQGLRRLTARLALAEGRRGMGDELAGRDPLPRYGAAYTLARLNDTLDRALDRMRP